MTPGDGWPHWKGHWSQETWGNSSNVPESVIPHLSEATASTCLRASAGGPSESIVLEARIGSPGARWGQMLVRVGESGHCPGQGSPASFPWGPGPRWQ